MSYFVPRYKNIIPMMINSKSKNFPFKFFSCKTKAPKAKLTITLPLRTIDIIDIIAPSRLNE